MTRNGTYQVRSLAEVASIVLGQSPPGESYNEVGDGLPFFQGKAEFGSLTPTIRKFTTAGSKFAAKGDILLSVRAPVGPTNIAPVDCAIGRGLAAIRAHECLDQTYLLWALRATAATLASRGVGSTFQAVTGAHVRAHQVSVAPTLAQQRRIVEILEGHLSRLDAADRGLGATRARLVALRRSTLELHFGLRASRTSLDDLVSGISTGKSFGSSNAPAQADEWGIIKVSAMTWGEFNPDENKAVPADRVDPRFEIRQGDLLISRANTSEYVGASVLVGEVRPRLLLSDKSLRLAPREGVSAEWLWRALQAPSARRQISGLATGTKDSMRNISQASLRRIQLPVMSERAQADAVAAYSEVNDACQRLEQVVSQQHVRSLALRRAVLAAAFDGKLTGRHTDAEMIEELAGA